MIKRLVGLVSAVVAIALAGCAEDDGSSNNNPTTEVEVTGEVTSDGSGGASASATVKSTTTVEVAGVEVKGTVSAEANLDGSGRLTGEIDGQAEIKFPIGEDTDLTATVPIGEDPSIAVTHDINENWSVSVEHNFESDMTGIKFTFKPFKR